MSIRIAIADDATFIREILRGIIQRQGWSLVAECENGEEAVSAIIRAKPDVVLMDMVMPRRNGIDAARLILSECPGIKIIACSTVDMNDILLRAIEAGCVSYINKPFNSEQVVNAVRSAVATYREAANG